MYLYTWRNKPPLYRQDFTNYPWSASNSPHSRWMLRPQQGTLHLATGHFYIDILWLKNHSSDKSTNQDPSQWLLPKSLLPYSNFMKTIKSLFHKKKKKPLLTELKWVFDPNKANHLLSLLDFWNGEMKVESKAELEGSGAEDLSRGRGWWSRWGHSTQHASFWLLDTLCGISYWFSGVFLASLLHSPFHLSPFVPLSHKPKTPTPAFFSTSISAFELPGDHTRHCLTHRMGICHL